MDKVASLLLAIDSTQAELAAKRLERMSKAAVAAETSSRKIQQITATSGDVAKRNADVIDRAERRKQAALKATEAQAERAAAQNGYLTRIAKRALAAASGVFLLAKAIQTLRYVASVNIEFERLGKQLEFVSGSSRGAAETLRFLGEEAQRTGVRLLEIAPIYSRMEFAMRQSNIATSDAQMLFRGVASAAATFALSQDDINRVLVAFTQVASKGTVQAEELRGQIGERLPGAFGLAAKSMGITTVELSKALELGNVLAKDLIPVMAVEMERVFGADMASKTDTITASLGRMYNEFDKLANSDFVKVVLANIVNDMTAFAATMNNLTGGDVTEMERVHDEILRLEETLGRINAANAEASEGGFFKSIRDGVLDFMGAGREIREVVGATLEDTSAIERQLRILKDRRVALLKEEEAEIERVRERERAIEEAAANEAIGKLAEDSNKRLMVIESRYDNEEQALRRNAENQLNIIDTFLTRASDLLENGLADEAHTEELLKLVERYESLKTLIGEELVRAVADLKEEAETIPEAFDLSPTRAQLMELEQQISRTTSVINDSINTLERGEDNNLLGQIFGSMGVGDQAQAELDALNMQFDLRMDTIKERKAQEGETQLELEKRNLEDILALRTEYNDSLQRIEGSKQAAMVEEFENFNDNILTLAQAGSKEALAVYKAVAIAQTIMGTYKGAQDAFNAFAQIPVVGPALGAAAAGVAIGAGLARVQAIRSTSVGAYEHGGMIPSGAYGIVGEAGPEVVRGPAVVTSARNTAARYGSGNNSGGEGTNVKVLVNNYSDSKATVRKTQDSDGGITYEVLIDRMERDLAGKIATGGSPLSRSLEGTFSLRRGM